MSVAERVPVSKGRAALPQLAIALRQAAEAVGPLLEKARDAVAARVSGEGAPAPAALEREQRAAHALAWLATYVECLRQLSAYAERMEEAGGLGETEALLAQIGAGEYLAQILGGIPMNQSEIARLQDIGVADAAADLSANEAVRGLLLGGNTAEARARLVALMLDAEAAVAFGDPGHQDQALDSMRLEMRRLARERIEPHAQAWHLANALVPQALIDQLGELGVFGLTIPQAHGGLGLPREAMCVVSEELTRGWIGVGSLATRTEIAAELILGSGTEAQKTRWLPRLASGEAIPTAVFTEPNTGSDLAAIRTRAVRDGDGWRITGQKTWITHAARADLMTLLARTDPASSGHEGLSMFLAEKPRGNDADPFPVPGISGSETHVLGYRGMREYELSFDGFAVPADALLGGVEGQGFRQLMRTFESARIQTAARGIGVAQAALDAALAYARTRVQFGKPIVQFPRVGDKLAMTAAEILIGRQLTYHAARAKDGGRRCDLEAGMAKLLTARIAWAAADAAVQIHGGNGYALEFPASRLLCDARILSIFEGTAEIQAQVIARRLLAG